MTISDIADDAGKPLYLLGLIEDITERKLLEEQLLQSQKMEVVGRLTGGIAHDFNNLLTPILAYADMSIGDVPRGSRVRDFLQEIRSAAYRAASLTRQLLTFSRRQVTQPKDISLGDIILDVDKMLRRLIGEDIELVCLPGPGVGLVRADPGQVEQVLINMAVNARDAMSGGGKLTIGTDEVELDDEAARSFADLAPGRYVRLSVTDTGASMGEEVKSHVFEPFFTTKGLGEGTGLGLATCYGIVKQSGGAIEVRSEPGQGTTFEVYWPRVDRQVGGAAADRESGDLPRGTETILLVEDEPSVRRLVAHVLRGQGYNVLEGANGLEALEVVRARDGVEIDLLLTDVVMPQMGGKELANILEEDFPSISVLFTTGYADNVLDQFGTPTATSGFIQKPFTPAELGCKVREMLDLPPRSGVEEAISRSS